MQLLLRRLFATGSRDQTVKLWAIDAQGTPQQKPIGCLPAFPVGVTAVSSAPEHVCTAAAAAGMAGGAEGLHLLAVGLEDGQVQVWSVEVPRQQLQDQQQQQQGEVVMKQLWASQAWEQHAAAVRRLRWAPAGVDWLCGSSAAGGSGGSIDSCVQLASCGDDHSVRVYGVTL
jgi:WD40 repeat protein